MKCLLPAIVGAGKELLCTKLKSEQGEREGLKETLLRPVNQKIQPQYLT